MGCMLRSDKMSLCEMYLQPDTAFDIISQLGELGCVEFTDVSSCWMFYQRVILYQQIPIF